MFNNKFSQTVNVFASTYLSRILATVFTLILSILITRLLGPFVKGQLSVILLIGSLCIILGGLGINSFNMYYAAKDKDKIKQLYVNSVWFCLIMSAISIITILLLIKFFPTVLQNIPSKHLLIYLASLPFVFFNQIIVFILAGEQKFKLYNFLLVLYPLLSLIFIAVLLLVLHLPNLKYLVVAYALTNVISGLLTLILAKPRNLGTWKFDRNLFQQALNYGLRIYSAGIFSILVLKADLYMVNFFRGPAEAGLYSLVSSFGDIFFLLPYSFSFIILPKIIPLENKDKASSIAKYFSITFYLSLLLSLGVFLFIKPVVKLLFGSVFLPSAKTIIILLPGLICWALVSILGQYFAATKYHVKIIIGWFVAFLLNIILNYLYIPQFGMKAAALTSDIAYFFILIYLLVLFRRETKMPSQKMFIIPKQYFIEIKNRFNSHFYN